MYLILIPYDGGAIGQFTGDAIREIDGYTGYFFLPAGFYQPTSGLFTIENISTAERATLGGEGDGTARNRFKASNVVPTAYENRSASTSHLACISY